MLRKLLLQRFLITLGWLALMSVLRWRYYLSFGYETLNLIAFVMGGIVGAALIDLDHWLYLLVAHPQHPDTLKLKGMFKERHYREALGYFYETRSSRTRLAFHSALFQPVLYLAAFFILTSTKSHFGAAMIMVMGLHLVWEEMRQTLTGQEEYLKKWLFWQIEVNLTNRQVKAFVLAMLFIFIALHLLLL